MNVHSLRERPAPSLARMLEEFETGFTYPLGPERWFRISHGEDYPRFFRAIGEATCFVAEQGGRVVGALGVAIRPLLMPDGSEQQTAYIGDLKVDPKARGTLLFLRLAQAALAWARPQVTSAYGVVMDGTRASPQSYTGRVGIPSFLQAGQILVVRYACERAAPAGEGKRWLASAAQGESCYRALVGGRYTPWGGTPAVRSEIAPMWLVEPDGTACGRLEDTRRAKRLIDSNGVEMQSAHLACFAARTPRAGAEIIQAARRQCAMKGIPALFVSVAPQDVAALSSALGPIESIIAPATIFAAGLPIGPAWNINSSEI